MSIFNKFSFTPFQSNLSNDPQLEVHHVTISTCRPELTYRVFRRLEMDAFPLDPREGDVIVNESLTEILCAFSFGEWKSPGAGSPISIFKGPKRRILCDLPLKAEENQISSRQENHFWMFANTLAERDRRQAKRKGEDIGKSDVSKRFKSSQNEKLEECLKSPTDSWTPPPGVCKIAPFHQFEGLKVPHCMFGTEDDPIALAEENTMLGTYALIGKHAREAPKWFAEFDNPDDPELPSKILQALVAGKMVVVNNMQKLPGPPYRFDLETAKRFQHQGKQSIQAHDAIKRADPTQNSGGKDPYRTVSMSEFFSKTDDSSICLNWLDSVIQHDKTPWFITEIDANVLMSSGDFGNHFIRKDMITMRQWQLWAHAASFTDWHRDADGAFTWIQVLNEDGVKLWFLAVPRDPERDQVQCLSLEDLLKCDSGKGKQKENEILYIPLKNGSSIIQPAGMWHCVYTPVPTVCIGGHFFPWETMHRTELRRHADSGTFHDCTNHDHLSVRHLINKMFRCLPSLDNDKELPVETVKAMCRMILRPYLYSEWVSNDEAVKFKATYLQGKDKGKCRFVIDGKKYVRKLDPSVLLDELEDEKKALAEVKRVMKARNWTESSLFEEYSNLEPPNLSYMPVAAFFDNHALTPEPEQIS